MSTPVEQYVPDEFQDEISLPTGSQVDRKAEERAAHGLAGARRNAKTYKRIIGEYKKKITAAKGDKKKIAWYQGQIKKVQAQMEAAEKSAASWHNKLLEARGEWDKLLQGGNRDAFLALQSMFNQFGLGSLAGKIFDYVKEGYGADTIALLLQDTKEYKQRFAANEARTKAGLPVLAPAEYLAAESAYRQILDSAGMPKGFYDNPADFTRWLAADVSPNEIKSRVDMATEAVNKVDPNYRAAMFQMYGVGQGDLVAYFLDRRVAVPLLTKQTAASAIGAAALRRGFQLNSLDLEGYASLGITGDEAEAAYARVADSFESMLGIAGRFGTTWTQREAEQEVFTPGAAGSVGSENSFEKSKRLKSQERAMFAGGRASSSQGLAAGYRQT